MTNINPISVNQYAFFITLLVLSIFTPYLTYAEKLNIEWIASEIAKNHNKNAKLMLDDMTVSSTAKAIGKNVIIKNTLRFKRDISEKELEEYRLGLYKELTPKVCRANADSPAFKEGLLYTFIYVSHYGQKLAEISFNKRGCDRYSINHRQ